jgi:hypothetical protein
MIILLSFRLQIFQMELAHLVRPLSAFPDNHLVAKLRNAFLGVTGVEAK